MKNIKMIAVDIDGVLLEDTFSPILYRLAKKYHKTYSQELEVNTFSQNRQEAAIFLKSYFEKDSSLEMMIQEYFEERDRYLNGRNTTINSGVSQFLNMLKALEIPLVCYGGLEEGEIDPSFTVFLSNFQEYICTNDFRPGLKEIISKYNLDFTDVLFIDDVAKVALEAKKFDIPFIGVPSSHEWGFQKQLMQKAGVKYMVSSIEEIT
ncbi:MAG: HAD family hydrolase, partial [Streptococcus sp.]